MEKNRVSQSIFQKDPWLEQSAESLNNRYVNFLTRVDEIVRTSGSVYDFASAHLYFEWQHDDMLSGWWFRQWLPNAQRVTLFGDFNQWRRNDIWLDSDSRGVWSTFLPDAMYADKLTHASRYKIGVEGENGYSEHIPAYAKRVVKQSGSDNFDAQFWNPTPYDWHDATFSMSRIAHPMIYESHIGMATEQQRVGTYEEFRDTVIPRVEELGYNTIQLMAIAEHPYYASFGYHVTNFFAPSSRFGTPEQLKSLIDTAHQRGIAVVMDIVHAHFAKNTLEGLNRLDGSDSLYSKSGDEGYHHQWDSMVFDYAKPEVEQFLLSNIRYWMEEFHFDGFRFDGATSIIYKHHGYTSFGSRERYFDEGVDSNGLRYLTLANRLIHTINPRAISIAEEVSGMPLLTVPTTEGGVGFDYRLRMSLPDYWIRLTEQTTDEQWQMEALWHEATDRPPLERGISYAESHDQALVGDKTLAMRLFGVDIYDKMGIGQHSPTLDRAVALHKMIRLFTATTADEGYLSFMGNEFGHPEWIDFPRQGNGWSYNYARRQWHLAHDPELKYSQLQLFDRLMIGFIERNELYAARQIRPLIIDQHNQTIVFSRGEFIFVFNFHPSASIPDYAIPLDEPHTYRECFSTDDPHTGGFGRTAESTDHYAVEVAECGHAIRIYNPSRCALILRRIDSK